MSGDCSSRRAVGLAQGRTPSTATAREAAQLHGPFEPLEEPRRAIRAFQVRVPDRQQGRRQSKGGLCRQLRLGRAPLFAETAASIERGIERGLRTEQACNPPVALLGTGFGPNAGGLANESQRRLRPRSQQVVSLWMLLGRNWLQ
jgi:hypothetical protein